METLLVLAARGLIAVVQRLPLLWVARLGRSIGGLAFWLDGRHRRVALDNLTLALGAERDPAARRALAAENFRRIGENFACAIRTAAMSDDEIRAVVTVAGAEKIGAATGDARSCVVAIGHFGNFELYARGSLFVPGYQFATTYRALRQPGLNRLFQDVRERSGCLYFERRTDANALKEAMNRQRLMIGFLADQHAGDRGVPAPFFGRECSTSAAPAVFALRYQCPLLPAICYRIAPGRWHVEVGDAIPTHEAGRPRPVEAIARDMNQAYEAAIRRDPANWFWVHRRWKTVHRRPRSDTSNPVAGGGSAPASEPAVP